MADASLGRLRHITDASGWKSAAISAVVGFATALGQAPYSAIWLAFPAICAAVFLAYSAATPRQAGLRGLFAGVGFAALTFVWIVEPFLVDIATDGWMAPFALIFMALGVGLFWAAAFWAARKVAPAGSGALLLALPVSWTVVEMLRSTILTGFPWGLTSYIWIDTPIYQFASFIGPHGLTLLTVLLASGVVACITDRRYARIAVYAAVLAVAWATGRYLQNQPAPASADPRPVVRLIQPNASQKQKWDPAMMPVFFERQLALTAEQSDTPPDLVIWPEVAVPFLLNDPTAPLDRISAAAGGGPVVIGAQRLQAGRAFNSLAVLGAGGTIEQIYDKKHLVPFGEYLPASALFARFGLRALAARFGNGYSAGRGPRVLDMGELGLVMPLICYEAIFPHELRRASIRPDWMMMVTNDAWFGQAAGPYQHLAQARARAVEMALPMVRAANTGISAVIDARGQIVDSLPLGQSGRLDVTIPAALPASLYWRFGDIPVAVMLFVLGLAVLGSKFTNPIDRPAKQG